MAYNTTGVDEANTMLDFMTEINNLCDGMYVGLILLAVFFIIFIVFKNYDTKAVLAADGFICSIIAILMWSLGWIGWGIVIIPIVVTAGAVIILFVTD